MSDNEYVYWVRSDGRPDRARAEVDLGNGAMRNYPRFGFRRMLWDFCFGYVSGYPVRDILAFCWHHGINESIEQRWLAKRKRIMEDA